MFSMENAQPRFSSESCPIYFKSALKWSYIIFIAFFVVYSVSIVLFGHGEKFLYVIPWLVAAGLSIVFLDRIHIRWSTLIYVLISIGWMTYFIYTYGWNCGGINFMVPLMIISFFSLYESLAGKIIFVVALFLIRIGLFFHSQVHGAVVVLTPEQSLFFQILNTFAIFLNIAIICIIFSTNIQQAEKHLMLYNMELSQQAATDPLTTLYNRRKMTEIVNNHMAANPDHPFCIAMGDIDLFKQVNDTYGHNCGDQVLKSLAVLFVKKTIGLGHVCRWGGEEFFFFLPEMNLDEASELLNELKVAVSKLPIMYNDEAHHVTMTFGVEEYDYRSSLEELVKRADDKLYYGKNHGRNQVVF